MSADSLDGTQHTFDQMLDSFLAIRQRVQTGSANAYSRANHHPTTDEHSDVGRERVEKRTEEHQYRSHCQAVLSTPAGVDAEAKKGVMTAGRNKPVEMRPRIFPEGLPK